MDLLIYLEKDSPRLQYIFHHIFHHVLGLNIVFTQDQKFFLESKIPKINYSKKSFSDELFFYASNFLFESNLKKQDLVFSAYNGVKIFFLCNNSALPFDPFASSFYMLTRYEEYLPHKKDRFGRFSVENSIAFIHEFLTTPVVDYWILFIKDRLKDRFPNLKFKQNSFKFINTIDVDNAYAYLEKGFFRNLGGLVKDLFSFRFKKICNRFHVLFFQEKDPYDTYSYILSMHRKYNLTSIFFFLLGDYRFYDRNINPSNLHFQNKIKDISQHCDVGIHTSMFSVKKPQNINIEIARLEHILNKKILNNRQHFLLLNLPQNYRNFIKSGIQHDYSMGFASYPGFRAGTSYNFYFFDLEDNCTTNLLIHPFSVMDVSLRLYLNLQPIKAFSLIQQLVKHVKYVNGTFISIWHNESLNDQGKWGGWNLVYEDMIKYIFDDN
tara:strand:+ start:2194 stop:3504 length:1311 start_codon:yes stop_codon:yes gene_type:complete